MLSMIQSLSQASMISHLYVYIGHVGKVSVCGAVTWFKLGEITMLFL